MSIQDDLFDITTLVEEHGSKGEQDAWDRIRKWAYEDEEALTILQGQMTVLKSAARVVQQLFPKKVSPPEITFKIPKPFDGGK